MKILKNNDNYLIGKDIQKLKDQNILQGRINESFAKAIRRQGFGGVCFGIAGMLMLKMISDIEKRIAKLEAKEEEPLLWEE